jgi:FixJ family two-component response regulator
MPEMPGRDLLRCVKGLYPDIVRIMLSGYTAVNSVIDAINEGAVHKFFAKPWDDGSLRQHIAEAFRHHEVSSEKGSPRAGD